VLFATLSTNNTRIIVKLSLGFLLLNSVLNFYGYAQCRHANCYAECKALAVCRIFVMLSVVMLSFEFFIVLSVTVFVMLSVTVFIVIISVLFLIGNCEFRSQVKISFINETK
jgi:hypothetical protein